MIRAPLAAADAVVYNLRMLTLEQLEIRKTGLGASECAVAVDLHDYLDRMQLYLRKVGLSEGPTDEILRIGHLMEPVIAQLYQDRNPEVTMWGGEATLRHPEYPWILATPDRFCRSGDHTYIMQMKNCGIQQRKNWGREGTDEIPHGYFCQVQWEMAVAGVDRCDVAVFFGGTELRVYPIRYSPEVFEKLREANERFWFDHVVPRVPPDLDGGDGTKEYLKIAFPKSDPEKTVQATEELDAVALEMKKANEKADEWSKKADAAKAKLCVIMADAELMKGKNWKATWKSEPGPIAWGQAYKDLVKAAEEAERAMGEGDVTRAKIALDARHGIPERHRSAPKRPFRTTFYKTEEELS